MHVVQVAPPWFPIPPRAYGGIERVVHDLTEGLVVAGHEVTLFAPAGSRTSARLIPTIGEGVGLDMPEAEKVRWFAETSQAAFARALALGADVVHDHTDHLAAPDYPLPVLHTVHGPVTDVHLSLYRRMSARGDAFVAISGRQRDLFEAADRARSSPSPPGERSLRFVGVVHNPTDVANAPFYPAAAKDDYVAYLGRCHWEKGPDAAVRVARAAGLRLKLALRITAEERRYFEAVVKPLIEEADGLVEFVGEVGGAERDELIGQARALLFTSPWEEPFGLVLAEAAARGTPVVALARGSAPEVVHDGVTGILCRNEAELAAALPRAMALRPEDCRAHALARFDRRAVAEQYVAVYAAVARRAAGRALLKETQSLAAPGIAAAPAQATRDRPYHRRSTVNATVRQSPSTWD